MTRTRSAIGEKCDYASQTAACGSTRLRRVGIAHTRRKNAWSSEGLTGAATFVTATRA